MRSISLMTTRLEPAPSVSSRHFLLLLVLWRFWDERCSVFPDDDWQEEHKRLAELDERDGLGAGRQPGGGDSSPSPASSAAAGRLPPLCFSSSSCGPPGQGGFGPPASLRADRSGF